MAVGQTLRLGDARVRVVGVATSEFRGVFGAAMATDVWVPLAQLPPTLSGLTRTFEIERRGFPVYLLVRVWKMGLYPASVANLLAHEHAGATQQTGSRASLWPVPTTPLSNQSTGRVAPR